MPYFTASKITPMSKVEYSKALCAELLQTANDPALKTGHAPTRYETGERLHYEITGVWPAVTGRATLEVEKFLGGGFAGQVYRCRLVDLDLPDSEVIEGLETGRLYAIKIIVPPSAFARRFRNAIYWLAFQAPFSAQVNYGACRSGLLLQKFIRRAARMKFGSDLAIKDAYASFWDGNLNAYGEITEWIEGRMWLLEADAELAGRKNWNTIPLNETGSPEYIAKRRFMAGMVELMHAMGTPEFARQYEWWTMKSQPNAMKRTDLPGAEDPDQGLCAIDFRAGLALLPYLPMSPGDIKLIFDGLFKRGALVQFDRCDLNQLECFVARNHDTFTDMEPALKELKAQTRAYRRSIPDITHHGFKLFFDDALRGDVRSGLIEGWRAAGLTDEAFEKCLTEKPFVFTGFYLLGILPLLGRFIRKLQGNAAYRAHIHEALHNKGYLRHALSARAAHELIEWHRAGRVNEKHARRLVATPGLFLLERFTLGLLPAVLHRIAICPARIGWRIRDGYRFLRDFICSSEFREEWFLNEIRAGEKEGMLTAEERKTLEGVVRDPFIVRYLKCLGVHFATVPITQIVSVLVGAVWAGWLLSKGHSWGEALGAFGLTVAVFQVIPISPGSICRGLFVVFLMIKERNVRDYLIAAPVSFLKYVGYLAFPLQMTTTYPHLARFMASRWATNMVHIVPVFGEKGALMEHWVFDQFFNKPQKFAHWAKPRMHWLLDGWMIFGLLLTGLTLYIHPSLLTSPRVSVNLILATVVLFVFPRVLFYPMLTRRKHVPAESTKL